MKLSNARTVLATLAVGVVVVSGTTACGPEEHATFTPGSAPAADAGQIVRDAVDKSGTESYHLALETSPESMTFAAEIDPNAQVMHMTMTVTAEIAEAEMDIDTDEDLEFEVIVIEDDGYLKFGGELADVFGDKWYEMPADDLGDLFSQDGMDPAAILDDAENVTRNGDLTYTGTIDADGEDLGMLGGDSSGVDLGAVPFTLTLDGQDRLASVEVVYPGVLDDGGDLTLVVSLDAYDEPVDVEAPPAEDVEEGGFGGI